MSENSRVAIYCRLSKDDEQSCESVSIETQKIMLTKYCSDHKFEIFDIYIDDGYSGLNFNRPSFKRLIQDLENGKFNIVVTKDLSRLGRDYIQTGYYIDVYFVTKNIRYIAVNDGIDTQQGNNDIAPFKNILNDMYAKDLSRKVKSAKQQRAQNGFYISAQPPYGYKVNPNNRNQLIVDAESAQIVKLIFELADLGHNYSEISRILEERKIISPSAYKAMNGDTRFLKFIQDPKQIFKWPYQTVKSILTNLVYVGDMVNHKVEVINYKTKKRVRIPTENQIVVQNKHEAIIDRERFELINQRLSNHKRKSNHNYENIFKGIVYCAECGEELQLISKKSKDEEKPMFRCPKHAKENHICTHHHFIYYSELLKEIQKQLVLHITDVINSNKYNELCEMILETIYAQAYEVHKNQLQKELLSINKKIKDYYKTSFFDTDDRIRADELDSLYSIQKSLMHEITGSTSTPKDMLNTDLNNIRENVQEYLYGCIWNEKNIKLFIKKIEVGYLDKTPVGTHQKITIYYRF